MTTTPIKRSVAITAIAASTLGGVAAGAAFFTPVIAGAQDDVVEAEQAAPERGERISEALQVLVDDGTLTEAQRDAVVDAIVARAEERLDTAVENGRIDDTQAAEMLTQAAERAEDLVNGEIEFGGRRGRLS